MKTLPADRRPIPSLLSASKREEWRRLPLAGAGNFRDLGGYGTRDGLSVKWGLLFRSGHLNRLDDQDVEYLRTLGIRKIVDLRGPSESGDEPDREIPGVSRVSLPIDIAGTDLRERIHTIIRGESEPDIEAYMDGVYRRFATDCLGIFGIWLKDLADGPFPMPQVVHCTAGKDRTGFASALFLSLLGVPRTTVTADYLKTNEYSRDEIEKTIRRVHNYARCRGGGEILRPLLCADERYLNTAFDVIDSQWGDFDTCVLHGLGLSQNNLKMLRSRFLE